MKKSTQFLWLILILLLPSGPTDLFSQSETDSILARLRQALQKEKALTYEVVMEVEQYGQKMKDTVRVFLDMDEAGSPLGARYAFFSDKGDILYDGRRLTSTVPAQSVVLDEEQPDLRLVQSTPLLLYSPFSLRNLVPLFRADTSVQVSLKEAAGEQEPGRVTLQVELNYAFFPSGEKFPGGPIRRQLEIGVDTSDNLPLFFRDLYPDGSLFSLDFRGMRPVENPAEVRWTLDSVPEGYLRMDMREYARLQQVQMKGLLGSPAPGFSLQTLEGQELGLEDFKGKPVLLEFWFPGCQGCLEAIPFIDRIREEYGAKGLAVLGIEFSDAAPSFLRRYMEKYGMELPTLLNAKQVAVDYGINAGPTFVLIDQDQRIVYMQDGLEEEALEKKIRDLLDP